MKRSDVLQDMQNLVLQLQSQGDNVLANQILDYGRFFRDEMPQTVTTETISQHRVCGVGVRIGEWQGPWEDFPDPDASYLRYVDRKPGNARVWVERRTKTVIYSEVIVSRDV